MSKGDVHGGELSQTPPIFDTHDILTSQNEKKLVFKSIGTSRINSYQLKEMTLSRVACSSLHEMNDTKHESKSRMSLLMCFLVWAKKTRWLQGFCLKAMTTKQFCPHKTSTYSLKLIKSIESLARHGVEESLDCDSGEIWVQESHVVSLEISRSIVRPLVPLYTSICWKKAATC